MTVPMVDLKKQFNDIKDEVFEIITEILESSQYILGPKVLVAHPAGLDDDQAGLRVPPADVAAGHDPLRGAGPPDALWHGVSSGAGTSVHRGDRCLGAYGFDQRGPGSVHNLY